MRKAQRHILKSDNTIKVLFDEKCVCGNRPYYTEEDEEYATCKQCLRVYRPIEMVVPEGIITMWGIYFDPYLEDSLAGQFMKMNGIKNLPFSKKEQIEDEKAYDLTGND